MEKFAWAREYLNRPVSDMILAELYKSCSDEAQYLEAVKYCRDSAWSIPQITEYLQITGECPEYDTETRFHPSRVLWALRIYPLFDTQKHFKMLEGFLRDFVK